MKRNKKESVKPSKNIPISTPAVDNDHVAEAIQKFQNGMNSSLPPLRLREFYSEDKIKEVAQMERKKVFDEFYPLVITFRGKDMGEMVTQLDAGIERVTEELQKTNRHHKEEIHLLLGKMMDFLCEEYKLWLETHLSLNPDTGTDQLKNLSQDEKTRIINFFSQQCNPWNAEVVQEQVSKLEEEVTRIQRVFDGNHLGRATSSASTATSGGSCSVPMAEKEKFAKMEGRILEICEDLKYSWNEESENLEGEVKNRCWERHGSHLDECVGQVEETLQDGSDNQFSHAEYQVVHDKLTQVLAVAIEALSFTETRTRATARKSTGGKAPRKACKRRQIAPTYVNGNDALMWERAFELDMRNCLPNHRASNQFKIDCEGYEFWLSKMILKKSCKVLIRQSSKWKPQSFSSTRKHQELVRSLELSLGVGYKSIRGPPKLFLERLFEVWKPRNWKVKSDAGMDDGSTSGQDSDSE